MLSVDEVVTGALGALSTVLSRTSCSDAVAQGSSAQNSSQARASTLTPRFVRTQQARAHNELEDDEVPPLPPPLRIIKEASAK